jgi:hypothetical protein
MIEKYFTTVFTVTRGVWETDINGFAYSAPSVVGTFSGHIQQIKPELAQYLNLNFTKTFSIWCPVGIDVLAGDYLNDGTYNYSVKESKINDSVGINVHLQLIVERSDELGS